MSGINQRDLNAGVKRIGLTYDEYSVIPTGVTVLVGIMPYNASLDMVTVATMGLSGSPVGSLSAYRGLSGVGVTAIGLGITMTFVNVGTSGVILGGTSLVAPPGVSLLSGDVIVMNLAGSNSALGGIVMNLVVRGLDDLRNWGGIPID